MVSTPATRALLAERRIYLARIASTEAKLAKLKSRLNLTEVKLVCLGYDPDRLRKTKRPEKLFKGRSIIRRIADIQRTAGRTMKAKELAAILASQDGLNPTNWYVRVSGRSRVKGALRRARQRGKLTSLG